MARVIHLCCCLRSLLNRFDNNPALWISHNLTDGGSLRYPCLMQPFKHILRLVFRHRDEQATRGLGIKENVHSELTDIGLELYDGLAEIPVTIQVPMIMR